MLKIVGLFFVAVDRTLNVFAVDRVRNSVLSIFIILVFAFVDYGVQLTSASHFSFI